MSVYIMKMIPVKLVAVITCFFSSTVSGEISTDGSLGAQLSLSGPNYQIGAELGQQRGNNLFHSFQNFSVFAGEKVTFLGPSDLHTVIARVTGGNLSELNGELILPKPGVNFYFVNPAGIQLGPKVKLDTQGSFHFSDGDYLGFADQSTFSAYRDEPILTTAAPEQFGFLAARSDSEIVLKGSQLEVPEQITISAANQLKIEYGSQLVASAVDIRAQLAILQRANITAKGNSSGLGKITIKVGERLQLQNRTRLSSTSSEEYAAGHIVLEAPWLEVDGSGDEPDEGSLINAYTRNQGNGGVIEVKSEHIVMRDDATFNVGSYDSALGKGGNIRIQTGSLLMQDQALMWSGTFGAGNAGQIDIQAQQLILEDQSAIASTTFSSGLGGNVKLQVFGQLELLNESVIMSGTEGTGAAGNVSILLGAGDLVSFLDNGESRVSVGSGVENAFTKDVRSKLNVARQRGAFVPNELFSGGGSAGQLQLSTDGNFDLGSSSVKSRLSSQPSDCALGGLLEIGKKGTKEKGMEKKLGLEEVFQASLQSE